ncbi:MAG: hypothetical protein K5790_01575 [Nitrosopumilus sp.]|uniref:hypothetical protein n=1 Tax=Nitrosopumilus sp. TaxID=2024843 RepID=UPI00247E1027|nr:hypothetical protein [Nitrosopumilus sp.]MCV0391963.1 hypothetical protein [Nitrosopumilus sp.]
MKSRLIIGIVMMILGTTLIPFLSFYSIFVSIPIVITGICIFASGKIKLSLSRIIVGTSSILGVYYLGVYLLLVSTHAIT